MMKQILFPAMLICTASCVDTCISSPISSPVGVSNLGSQFSDLGRLQLMESSDYVLRLKHLKFCADWKGNLVGIQTLVGKYNPDTKELLGQNPLTSIGNTRSGCKDLMLDVEDYDYLASLLIKYDTKGV